MSYKIRIKKETFDNINYGIESIMKFWIKFGILLLIVLFVKILIFYCLF